MPRVRYRLTIITMYYTVNSYCFLRESDSELHSSDFDRINPSTRRLTLWSGDEKYIECVSYYVLTQSRIRGQ